MRLLEHKEVLRLNEPIVGKVKTSFFRRNFLKVSCVIIIIVLSALLYNTSRLYFYEQNMRRYAIYWDYSEIQDGFRVLAAHIRDNITSLLPSVIPETAAGLIDAAKRLGYLDVEHNDVWLNIRRASDGIRRLNSQNYFPNGSWWFPPDQIYQHILNLSASLAQAVVEWGFTSGEHLYYPGANALEWNEDMLLNASQTAKNLYQLIDGKY